MTDLKCKLFRLFTCKKHKKLKHFGRIRQVTTLLSKPLFLKKNSKKRTDRRIASIYQVSSRYSLSTITMSMKYQQYCITLSPLGVQRWQQFVCIAL